MSGRKLHIIRPVPVASETPPAAASAGSSSTTSGESQSASGGAPATSSVHESPGESPITRRNSLPPLCRPGRLLVSVKGVEYYLKEVQGVSPKDNEGQLKWLESLDGVIKKSVCQTRKNIIFQLTCTSTAGLDRVFRHQWDGHLCTTELLYCPERGE